jgi:pyridoxine 5-phosphate synthase
MTRLSVNINKIATLRNARGGNNPNVVQVAVDCEKFGAEGITVHPRPDERHITRKDVYDLKKIVTTEFNIEGYPDDRYMEIVLDVRPEQATLVPDPPDTLTSNAGWDTLATASLLKEVIAELKKHGMRVSIFVDPDEKMVEGAAECGADRIELYTEPYAANFHEDREKAVGNYMKASEKAKTLGLGLNAGHDLDLHNLHFLITKIPYIDEVSIGHALISDALYYGLENTIQMYKRKLKI